jgi:hypothetical protein
LVFFIIKNKPPPLFLAAAYFGLFGFITPAQKKRVVGLSLIMVSKAILLKLATTIAMAIGMVCGKLELATKRIWQALIITVFHMANFFIIMKMVK